MCPAQRYPKWQAEDGARRRRRAASGLIEALDPDFGRGRMPQVGQLRRGQDRGMASEGLSTEKTVSYHCRISCFGDGPSEAVELLMIELKKEPHQGPSNDLPDG